MAIDVKKWRDAGVPADLIAILVDINRAAARIPQKGERGVGIRSLSADPVLGGIVITLTDDTSTRIEGLNAGLAEADAAAIASAVAGMNEMLEQASGFAAQAGTAATEAVEAALAQLPDGPLPAGVEGQIVGYGAGGVPIAINPPAGGTDYDEGPLLELIAALTGRVNALEEGVTNRAPVATDIPEQTATVGMAYSFDASGYFDDPDGDALIFSISGGALPPGITLTDGSFTGNPTKGGTYTATLASTDPGGLEDSLQITWKVGQTPNVTATASISASGTILDGPLDAVTGYPAPEPAFQWFDGDEAIPAATLKSFDHGGTDGAYRRQTRWTNGVGSPAVSTPNAITIAPAPGIEVDSLTPNPMIAGQPFEIVFNTTLAANEVTSSVTLSGTGTTRTGTAPADDTVNVSVSATKSGWRPFSQAFDVQPLVAEIFTASSPAIFGFRKLSTTTSSFAISAPAQYAGTGSVSTAQAVSGPEPYIEPSPVTVSGNAVAVGETLRFRKGAFYSRYLNKPGLTWDWWADDVKLAHTGETLLLGAAHAGKLISVRWRATDDSGATFDTAFASAKVPSASNIDTFDTNHANLHGVTTESGETWTRTGGTGVLSTSSGEVLGQGLCNYVRGAADRGNEQHVWAEIRKGANAAAINDGVEIACCMAPDSRAAYMALVLSTNITIRRINADGTNGGNLQTYTFAATGNIPWTAGETKRVDMLRNNTTGSLIVKLDGIQIMSITHTALTSGGCGLVGDGSGDSQRPTKFGIGA